MTAAQTRVISHAGNEARLTSAAKIEARSVQLLEECYAQKICIGKLAAQVGHSPRHFARSFLQATAARPTTTSCGSA